MSVAGLGCGGPSRLGLKHDYDTTAAENVVRCALDEGITLVDTAEAYGTEEVVGRALAGRRDGVFLTTKASVSRDGNPTTPSQLIDSLDGSLRKLHTDHVDGYLFHGVTLDIYDHVLDHLVPVALEAKAQGKIGHIGISEAFIPDPGHAMLSRAVSDSCWEIVMVGFNMLNFSARERFLGHAMTHGVGTLGMFAVRRALSVPDNLTEVVSGLYASGHLEPGVLDGSDPLGFLGDIVDAAYRFCVHEPGLDVVLTGTGNTTHLRHNIESMLRPPLPAAHLQKLHEAFRSVDHVSGN